MKNIIGELDKSKEF